MAEGFGLQRQKNASLNSQSYNFAYLGQPMNPRSTANLFARDLMNRNRNWMIINKVNVA